MNYEKIIYACNEHIDMAIDDIVNFTEKAPKINLEEEGNKSICSYCKKHAEYKVTV